MLHKQISWPVCIRKRTMVGYEGINEKKNKDVDTGKNSHCSKRDRSQPKHHRVPTSCVTAKMMGYGWHFENRHSAHHRASEIILIHVKALCLENQTILTLHFALTNYCM